MAKRPKAAAPKPVKPPVEDVRKPLPIFTKY